MRRSILLPFAILIASCGERDSAPPQDPAASGSPASSQAEPGARAEGGKLDRSNAGRPAPATEFLAPDGERTTIADFAGKPVLLNLWATWCAPCVAEMPTLDSLAGRDPGLQLLVVSQDMEGQEDKVATFFEERKLTRLEPYRDPQMGLMTDLGAGVLPTTILFDSEGREVWRMTGAADWTGAETARLIAEARP